jgi:hypothetical protein
MGLTGILFAHRLALWRDRRREFNAVAEEIREALYAEIRALPYPSEGLSIAQRNKLRSVQIGPIRRLLFHYAECHYGDQKWKSKPEVAYKNPYGVQDAIERLWEFSRKIK